MNLHINARFLAGIFIFLLSGCGTLLPLPPQTAELLHSPPQDLPRHVELVNAPFFPQEEYQCGPAALATVLNNAGISITPDILKQYVYIPEREGSLQVEMLTGARRNGMLAYQMTPDLEDVLREVAAGTPVIVLQNLFVTLYPLWHYAVVVGYDLDENELILRSGREQRLLINMRTFEFTWARSKHWAMIVIPPSKIPATAKQDNYVKAAVGLERSGTKEQARTAYQTALSRWPQDLVAQIGLGNSCYGLGDLKCAEAAFRQGSLDHPGSAAAFNNLAQTLLDEGKLDDAEQAARKAVSLGGETQKNSEETLTQILAKRQAAAH